MIEELGFFEFSAWHIQYLVQSPRLRAQIVTPHSDNSFFLQMFHLPNIVP